MQAHLGGPGSSAAAGTPRADTTARPASTSRAACVSSAAVLSCSWLAATARMARSLGRPPPLPAEISCAPARATAWLAPTLP
jgi:hypothetical protein